MTQYVCRYGSRYREGYMGEINLVDEWLLFKVKIFEVGVKDHAGIQLFLERA